MPAYCNQGDAVHTQLEKGIAFFCKKYPAQQYMAYFQSYSNTYASVGKLKRLYEDALSLTGIKGLIISTRPDCLSNEVLELLSSLSKHHYIKVELGLESTSEKSLERINRCHTWDDSLDAIVNLDRIGIPIGVHFILGLPGETYEDMMSHASVINTLPVQSVKLHQLQVIRHTLLARSYESQPENIRIFELDSYIETVIDFIEKLRPDIMIERFGSEAPDKLLIAPKWGLKNFELIHKIEKRMDERDTLQGRLFSL